MEIWTAVTMDFYTNRYLVSNYGNIKRIDGVIVSQNFDSKGYLKVALYNNKVRKTVKVHRLVASAFIENPENKPQVNHIDGVKTNNNVNNLEWVTAKENVKHAYDNDLAKTGKERHSSKRILLKYNNGNVISQYSTLATLSDTIGIGASKLLKTLRNNNVSFELIDDIDNKLPLDLKLNSFHTKYSYCPIAIYDEDMHLIAIYSSISSMTKYTVFPEYIGNTAKLDKAIKYKRRGKEYKKFYYLKKLSFEDFFTLKCDTIDSYLEVK